MAVNELIIKGRVIKDIYLDNEHLMFKLENDDVFIFHHIQECCENVYLDQIDGDLQDLIGVPLLIAEEVVDSQCDDYTDESVTWTFYKFATIKGYVTVRWTGESNGYYSESVNMDLITDYDDFTVESVLKNWSRSYSEVYLEIEGGN